MDKTYNSLEEYFVDDYIIAPTVKLDVKDLPDAELVTNGQAKYITASEDTMESMRHYHAIDGSLPNDMFYNSSDIVLKVSDGYLYFGLSARTTIRKYDNTFNYMGDIGETDSISSAYQINDSIVYAGKYTVADKFGNNDLYGSTYIGEILLMNSWILRASGNYTLEGQNLRILAPEKDLKQFRVHHMFLSNGVTHLLGSFYQKYPDGYEDRNFKTGGYTLALFTSTDGMNFNYHSDVLAEIAMNSQYNRLDLRFFACESVVYACYYGDYDKDITKVDLNNNYLKSLVYTTDSNHQGVADLVVFNDSRYYNPVSNMAYRISGEQVYQCSIDGVYAEAFLQRHTGGEISNSEYRFIVNYASGITYLLWKPNYNDLSSEFYYYINMTIAHQNTTSSQTQQLNPSYEEYYLFQEGVIYKQNVDEYFKSLRISYSDNFIHGDGSVKFFVDARGKKIWTPFNNTNPAFRMGNWITAHIEYPTINKDTLPLFIGKIQNVEISDVYNNEVDIPLDAGSPQMQRKVSTFTIGRTTLADCLQTIIMKAGYSSADFVFPAGTPMVNGSVYLNTKYISDHVKEIMQHFPNWRLVKNKAGKLELMQRDRNNIKRVFQEDEIEKLGFKYNTEGFFNVVHITSNNFADDTLTITVKDDASIAEWGEVETSIDVHMLAVADDILAFGRDYLDNGKRAVYEMRVKVPYIMADLHPNHTVAIEASNSTGQTSLNPFFIKDMDIVYEDGEYSTEMTIVSA